MKSLPLAGKVSFAVRFPNGEFIKDPLNFMATTTNLAEAHLWLRLSDESPDDRAAWLITVARRMRYPSGTLVAVRAR